MRLPWGGIWLEVEGPASLVAISSSAVLREAADDGGLGSETGAGGGLSPKPASGTVFCNRVICCRMQLFAAFMHYSTLLRRPSVGFSKNSSRSSSHWANKCSVPKPASPDLLALFFLASTSPFHFLILSRKSFHSLYLKPILKSFDFYITHDILKHTLRQNSTFSPKIQSSER